MDSILSIGKSMLSAIFFGGILLAGAYFIPWSGRHWGMMEFAPTPTITVSGQAQTKERNQIASFSAGVNVTSDNKDTAVNEVNQKVSAIIKSAKDFGIKADDIKTQNVSVYQMQEQYWEDGRQKQRPGQWQVSNSIEITLRDADRGASLADMLTKSGANQVHGPNFRLDDTRDAENELLADAIESARSKAQIIAVGSGRTLGKILTVTEGGSTNQPPVFYAREGGGGGSPIEPGSSNVQKTITVVFELK